MFDARHLQNVQPTAAVNVAEKSNFQAPSSGKIQPEKIQRPNARTLLADWRFFEFGFWNLEISRRIANSAMHGLLA